MHLNLERTRYVDSGGGEMVLVSESKRAQLKLGERVYVGYCAVVVEGVEAGDVIGRRDHSISGWH